MATIKFRCAANHPSIRNHDVRLEINRSNLNQLAPFPRSSPIPDQMAGILSSTPPLLVSSPCPPRRRANAESCRKIVDRDVNRKKAVLPEKLDEWMRDSVVEIVKNLREAPLLVHVYSNDNGEALLKTEKAIAEDWPAATRRWKNGDTPSPDGVILVEELRDKDDLNAGAETEEEGSREWGVVVQGRGVECGPACYLLKTSRAGSDMGLGCTHFCLMRVQNFRESALSQLTNCWLLQ